MPKSPPAPTFEIRKVDPDLAKEWLGRNTHNRNVRPSHVRSLIRAMERDEWLVTGEPIVFDVDGVLQDGQHRLLAVVESGKVIETLVAYNVDKRALHARDTGARRSLGDTLRLLGHKDAAKVAAAINYFYRWQVADSPRSNVKPTIFEALDIFGEHPGLAESVKAVNRVLSRFRMSSGMLAATHYVLSTIDSDQTEAFFHRLTYGEGLEAGSPILVLRQYLEAQSNAGVGARASSVVHHALLIKAWNAWRENLHVERLSWKSGGMRAEAFPEPY